MPLRRERDERRRAHLAVRERERPAARERVGRPGVDREHGRDRDTPGVNMMADVIGSMGPTVDRAAGRPHRRSRPSRRWRPLGPALRGIRRGDDRPGLGARARRESTRSPWERGRLVGHASVIQRRLIYRERALRTGYVEARRGPRRPPPARIRRGDDGRDRAGDPGRVRARRARRQRRGGGVLRGPRAGAGLAGTDLGAQPPTAGCAPRARTTRSSSSRAPSRSTCRRR